MVEETHPSPPCEGGSAIRIVKETHPSPPCEGGSAIRIVKGEHKGRICSWLAILLFLIGASIYLLFRSREHLGFVLVDAIGLGNAVDLLRASVSHIHPCEFVLYSLPDGLWTVSYILIMDYVFRHEKRSTRLLWAGIIPALGILTEVLQLTPLIPGVFDPFDLLCYVVPFIVYSIMNVHLINS